MVDVNMRQVADVLSKCARALCAEPPSGAPLRSLQVQLRELLEKTESPTTRVLAFVLDVVIDDYYYNLTGNIPSEISVEVAGIRHRFLSERFGPALADLASAVRDNPTSSLAQCEKVILAYLDAVEETQRIAGAT